jgi:predicted kinase
LIVFGGLPATGKTTIARELTRRLAATYLRIDMIEQRLRDEGLALAPPATSSPTRSPRKTS